MEVDKYTTIYRIEPASGTEDFREMERVYFRGHQFAFAGLIADGENMAHGGVLSMRWYEISWRDRGFEGRGLYEGVVHRRVYSLDGVRGSEVVGYVGIGVDIDGACDGFIVDRVMMEWRVMVEGLNSMG